MFRKVFTASIIGLMLSSALVATSASAATISNGVACPKANKTTKVGDLVYKCIKSPTINKTKLTWTSMDCISTNASYLKSNASYLALAKQMPETLAALDVKIDAAKVDAAAALAKATAADAKIQTLQGKLAQFQAEIAAMSAVDKSRVIAKTHLTVQQTYDNAIRLIKSEIGSYTAASAGYGKVGKTVALMQATRAATVSQLAQTKSGVAQTLSMRNLVCGKGM